MGEIVLYSPTVPETNQYQNRDLNAPGSKYAQAYGHQVTTAIQRAVRQIIYDAAPQQYFDLKILGMKSPQMRMSDEVFYHEMAFGRDPIIVGATAGIAGGVTQVIPVTNINAVSTNMLVVYEDNTRGTVS